MSSFFQYVWLLTAYFNKDLYGVLTVILVFLYFFMLYLKPKSDPSQLKQDSSHF